MHNAKTIATALCLAGFLILAWFVSGVTLLQGWGNYPMWLDMGAMMSNDDFKRLREAHYGIIYPLAVYPGTVAGLLNVALLVLRPPGIAWWLLAASFALGLVIGAATFAIQIPLQDLIDANGYDRDVLERLIETDLWTRKVPGLMAMAVYAAITGQVAWNAIGGATRSGPRLSASRP